MKDPNCKKTFLVLVLFLILHFLSASQIYGQSEKIKSLKNINSNPIKLQKQTINDQLGFIDVNNILMYFENNGRGSYSPVYGTAGLFWPNNNDPLTVVFTDGLLIGGKVSEKISVIGSTYFIGLQAGKILDNGKADDPSLSKYRIYKIRKNWEQLPLGQIKSNLEKDYNEWPVADGAPWLDNDNDGVFNSLYDEPAFLGDEVNWMVMNDLDVSRSLFQINKPQPMGLEIQCTAWGYKIKNILKDVIFKKYKIINKGNKIIKDTYIGIWSDPDLGHYYDDYIGCDTTINLGYCYNFDNYDEGYYGLNPPAVGYKILQGPIVKGNVNDSARVNNSWKYGFNNLEMSAFAFISEPTYFHSPYGPLEYYNFLKGKLWDGNSIINPHNNKVTKFMLSGDPENETGWFEGVGWPGGLTPGDRRFLISSGPFDFAPNDTQEITFAIIVARGNNNRNSVTHLKRIAESVQMFYDDFKVESVKKNIPKKEISKVGLGQNHPNPFNSSTMMKYAIPWKSKVTIKVYDMLGNEVAVLLDEEKEAGEYQINFDASNLSSGIYFCSFRAREITSIKKLIVLK